MTADFAADGISCEVAGMGAGCGQIEKEQVLQQGIARRGNANLPHFVANDGQLAVGTDNFLGLHN